MSDITRDEMHQIAEEAAGKAVRDTFRLLGVDIKDQASLNEFRADLISARQNRRMKETLMGRIGLIVITAATVLLGSAFWDGFKAKFQLFLN